MHNSYITDDSRSLGKKHDHLSDPGLLYVFQLPVAGRCDFFVRVDGYA